MGSEAALEELKRVQAIQWGQEQHLTIDTSRDGGQQAGYRTMHGGDLRWLVFIVIGLVILGVILISIFPHLFGL